MDPTPPKHEDAKDRAEQSHTIEDEKLPSYIPNPNISIGPEKIIDNPPQYSTRSNVDNGQGWRFMICNKTFSDDLVAFVSEDSIEMFNTFKERTKGDPLSPAAIHAREQQSKGLGVPLLKVKSHNFHVNKFLTIQIYFIDKEKINSRGFKEKEDLYDFCIITKYMHVEYTTYVLKFTPDPIDRSQDFEIVIFVHSVLPVNDYIYKNDRYRWIQESATWGKRHNYTNLLLQPDQHALTDNWNRETYKLDKQIDPKNPLIGGYLKKVFSTSSRKRSKEYYSSIQLGVLEQNEEDYIFGSYRHRAQYITGDNYTPNDGTVDYESINSVNLDALTRLCMAILFKRREDIIEAAASTYVA
ncbi:uncharacterized protein RJT20DRAFT_147983 [Scheffersomyces xylosifermentans]|uniref:uncharacterized protein n=1 Tax=Scheffersomyces xylosifermentans TaxID=1304137 RepID=UPI00315DB006